MTTRQNYLCFDDFVQFLKGGKSTFSFGRAKAGKLSVSGASPQTPDQEICPESRWGLGSDLDVCSLPPLAMCL